MIKFDTNKLFMRIRFIFILSLFFYTSACTNTKPLSSKLKSTEIQELVLFNPITSFAYFEKEDQGFYDDSLSLLTEKILSDELLKIGTPLPNIKTFTFSDENFKIKLDKDIVTACRASSAYNSIDVLPIPPSVDAILESQEKRFGLLLYYSGYKRSSQSFKWAKKRAFIDNLSTTIPIVSFRFPFYVQFNNAYKSNVILYAMIVDAKTNKIVFFKESFN